MTRRITETFHGYNQPDILVTLPDDHDHPGSTKACCAPGPSTTRRATDWWGMCNYTVAPGVTYLGWIHEDQLRRDGDLHDDDGLLGPFQTDQSTEPAPMKGES